MLDTSITIKKLECFLAKSHSKYKWSSGGGNYLSMFKMGIYFFCYKGDIQSEFGKIIWLYVKHGKINWPTTTRCSK